MCYSELGTRKKEKDRGNRCRTPKSPRYIDLVEIMALMATVNWSMLRPIYLYFFRVLKVSTAQHYSCGP
jgi:hypothetical protein